MILAEFEVWHSRPIAPTRRLALGLMNLPVDPVPGFGGVLLAAVLSVHVREVDNDLVADVHRLLNEVERGHRVVQPRLRHRFQADRHGLAVSVHRLSGEGDSITFEFGTGGTPLQQVLGSIYVLERLEANTRRELARLMRKAISWRGPLGSSFVAYLMGGHASSISAVADPRAWALETLGFPSGTIKVTKKDVMARYRESLRFAHPDHGGNEDNASVVIRDLTEARRVLLETL